MSRCFSCFKEFGDEFEVCPYCGTIRTTKPKEPVFLRPGTILCDRYLVGEAVDSGGFGVIYKAWDMKLETVIAIKEFFASRLMTRAEGEKEVIVTGKNREEFEYRKRRFLAEARNMAKFSTHRSIPNVYEFFQENGTAYIVMELFHGGTLNNYLHEHRGIVDRDFAVYITNEVGKALISLHEKGIIHLDVAPDNIYICSGEDKKIKLLDLGAAKLTDCEENVVDIVLKPGYSPVEQYDNSNIGPWSDVYALGATLYVMLTGIKPDESTNRKEDDPLLPPHEVNNAIPENLSNAVMKAMAMDIHMRYKSVAEFLNAINSGKKVLTLEKEKKLRKRKRFSGVLAAALICLAFGSFVFYSYKTKKAEEILDDASITVWCSVEDGSKEEAAMQSIINDFTEKYPNVSVELKAIPEEEYPAAVEEAAAKDALPTVFESGNLPDSVLDKAKDADKVLQSEMAGECLFLDGYDRYYPNHKQIPLGIEIPMAVVITNGNTAIDYKDEFFSSPESFGSNAKIALDENARDLIEENYTLNNPMDEKDFFDNESNKAAVLLTSTMSVNRVRSEVINYTKEFVFPNQKEIRGKFVYEWSIGDGNHDEIAAGEKLLSWMLGNAYQNKLMISQANDGQIPINSKTFDDKTSQNLYLPMKKIMNNIVIER